MKLLKLELKFKVNNFNDILDIAKRLSNLDVDVEFKETSTKIFDNFELIKILELTVHVKEIQELDIVFKELKNYLKN